MTFGKLKKKLTILIEIYIRAMIVYEYEYEYIPFAIGVRT